MVQLPRKPEDEANSADTGMISLSGDDLYQYSVAQTNVDSGGAHENVDIHNNLATLPHQEPIHLAEGMKVKQLTPVKLEKKPTTNEPNEFPDLLGSDNNLATLNSNFDYTHYESSDEKINQLLKSSTIKKESGLTFAALSGLDPVYPDVDISTLAVK